MRHEEVSQFRYKNPKVRLVCADWVSLGDLRRSSERGEVFEELAKEEAAAHGLRAAVKVSAAAEMAFSRVMVGGEA